MPSKYPLYKLDRYNRENLEEMYKACVRDLRKAEETLGTVKSFIEELKMECADRSNTLAWCEKRDKKCQQENAFLKSRGFFSRLFDKQMPL